MANISWNLRRKAKSASYDSAKNWISHVPGSDDNANFNFSGTRNITISQEHSVASWHFSFPGYVFTIKPSGAMEFVGAGIVGGAKIVNNNELTFSNASKAGFSTIVTNNHGTTIFKDSSISDNARLTTNAGGVVDFSGASAIMRATMIAGAGKYYLGDNQLIVGGTNLSGKVSGGIFDGDPLNIIGGTGASVVKEGTGTLSLFGHNIYTGGTIIRGGTLDVGSADGAGTGGITLAEGAQTVKVEKGALVSNTFATEIHEFHAGDTIDLPGLKFKMGAAALYHTDTHVLDITSGNTTVHLTLPDPELTTFRAANDGKGGTKVFIVGTPVNGGPNDDTLQGTVDIQDFNGGGGKNTVSYENATAGVTASLAAPQNNTGWASGDLYTNIQNLTGSAHDDILTGDSKANVLIGGAGTNTLDGGGGNDVLVSTSGLDTLKGGKGADHFRLDNLLQGADPWGMIFDFSRKEHDKIDLRGLEATLGLDLKFVGHDNNFKGVPGEVGYDFSDYGVTLSVNIDNDKFPELYFEVWGRGIYDLKASDFLL